MPTIPYPSRPGGALSFLPEWTGLVVIAGLEAVLFRSIGFHLLMTWRNGAIVAIVLSLMLLLYGIRQRRGGMIMEYVALNLVASALFCLLGYLSMAVSGPLA